MRTFRQIPRSLHGRQTQQQKLAKIEELAQTSSNCSVWVAGAEQDAKPQCRRGVEESGPATQRSRHKTLKVALIGIVSLKADFVLHCTSHTPGSSNGECAKRCFQAKKRSFELAKRLENRPRIAACCNTETLSHFAQFKALSTCQGIIAEFWRIPLQKYEVRSRSISDSSKKRWDSQMAKTSSHSTREGRQ